MKISSNFTKPKNKEAQLSDYLENKLGGENPAMCCGENGAEWGGGIPGPIPPWLALVTGGDERPGIIELPIELGELKMM